MPDKTVTLSDQDWQQLTAIIANATGYLAFQRLVQQLQAQDGPRPVKGDGLDLDPQRDALAQEVAARRVPRVPEPGR